MIKANLPARDDLKQVFAVRLYQSVIGEIDSLSVKTGIRRQDLIRIAINNFLDSKEVKDII